MNDNTPDTRSNKSQQASDEKPGDMASWKPGSESDKAAEHEASGDFGVHASRGSRADRDYTSRNTKLSDPGHAQPWSRENADGVRTAGAAGHASGTGSSSGGDVDTDLIGVGTGGSVVSQSGPVSRPGADDTDGSSDEFASGGHAPGTHPEKEEPFKGSTYTGEMSQDVAGRGADNATNPARDDDSFAGEISSGEARGEDNEMGSVPT